METPLSWAQMGPTLAAYARGCIEANLDGPPPRRPAGADYEAPGAAFVSLHRGEALHGCIGSLVAWRPLVDDVRRNALAAAFEDPRAPGLDREGLRHLTVEVSRLSPPTPIAFRDEADLLARLRPFEDGLILSWRGHRGTFLPQVWEHLPTAREFWSQLKRKAGLPTDFWAEDAVVERYTVEAALDPAPLPP